MDDDTIVFMLYHNTLIILGMAPYKFCLYVWEHQFLNSYPNLWLGGTFSFLADFDEKVSKCSGLHSASYKKEPYISIWETSPFVAHLYLNYNIFITYTLVVNL